MRKYGWWLVGMTVMVASVGFLGGGCRGALEREVAFPAKCPASDAVAVVWRPQEKRSVFYGDAALARRRFPPCSTFKIVSTLMGLEAGVLAGLETRLGYDGTRYELEAWNQDVTLAEAFRFSCVWYYKKLISRLDKNAVQASLDQLDYGNCDISVWNSNGHNVFWIESSLLISPLEQIGVLEQIFSGQTKFKPEHVAILKACMALGNAGNWAFYGKTGTGRNHVSNRLEAWFVGFAEAPDGEQIYFAIHGADPARDVVSAELREVMREIVAGSELQ